MTRFRNADSILGAVFLVLGVALLFVSMDAGESAFVLPGDAPPYLVPRIYLYLWIAIALVILMGGLLGRGDALPRVNWARFAGVLFFVIFGAVAMPLAGFLISATVTVIGVCWMLGYRRLWVIATVALSSVLSIWVLLVMFARMPLPPTPGIGI
ncbi:MAG: tripartite tricarboxylate transporter TctB family protein [Rhodospirillales bacterium]|nr:tripartite tricarboxylate transporter TctB family protein [Rhodospirillales bacterium]